MSLLVKNKYPDVRVRRGNLDLGLVNLDDLPDQLNEGKLLASDRISINGHTWFRLDKFPELRHVQASEKSFLEKDITELVKKKYPDVMVRRGLEDIGTFNLKKIPDRIQAGKLLPSDRISINGESWHRLDKLPELKYFFLNKKIEAIQARREKLLHAAKIATPVVLTLLAGIVIYLMPYLTFYRIVAAVQDGDQRTFSALVDLEALSKTNPAIEALATARAQKPTRSPGKGAGNLSVEGFRGLVELDLWQQQRTYEAKHSPEARSKTAVPRLNMDLLLPHAELHYETPNRFLATLNFDDPALSPIEMTFKRRYLGWRLIHFTTSREMKAKNSPGGPEPLSIQSLKKKAEDALKKSLPKSGGAK